MEKKKLSDRKAFNFYRSYYDLAKELSDKDRLSFYDAVINYQFTKEEIELFGMAKIAFISQKHSLVSQVEGFENVGLRRNVNGTFGSTSVGASVGGKEGASVQVQVQVQKKREKKPKNVFTPPTLLEVKDYFKENGYKLSDAERCFNGYNISGWIDSKGNPIRNWKQKCIHVWFKDENKESTDIKIQVSNLVEELKEKHIDWIDSLKPSMYNTTTLGVLARIKDYIKFINSKGVKECGIDSFKDGFGKWYEKHKTDY